MGGSKSSVGDQSAVPDTSALLPKERRRETANGAGRSLAVARKIALIGGDSLPCLIMVELVDPETGRQIYQPRFYIISADGVCIPLTAASNPKAASRMFARYVRFAKELQEKIFERAVSKLGDQRHMDSDPLELRVRKSIVRPDGSLGDEAEFWLSEDGSITPGKRDSDPGDEPQIVSAQTSALTLGLQAP